VAESSITKLRITHWDKDTGSGRVHDQSLYDMHRKGAAQI